MGLSLARSVLTTQISMLFPKCTKQIPASGTLYLPPFLPGRQFPQVLPWLLPHLFWSLCKCHLIKKSYPDHTGLSNSTLALLIPSPLTFFYFLQALLTIQKVIIFAFIHFLCLPIRMWIPWGQCLGPICSLMPPQVLTYYGHSINNEYMNNEWQRSFAPSCCMCAFINSMNISVDVC